VIQITDTDKPPSECRKPPVNGGLDSLWIEVERMSVEASLPALRLPRPVLAAARNVGRHQNAADHRSAALHFSDAPCFFRSGTRALPRLIRKGDLMSGSV
jgi:hypothetical protein